VTGFYIYDNEPSSLELSSCQISILLQMKELGFYETLGVAYPVMRYYVPKELISHSHWRVNLEVL